MLQQQQVRRQTERFVFVLANEANDDDGRLLRREILRLRHLLATEWSPRRVILTWLQGVNVRRRFLRTKHAATFLTRHYRGYRVRARWSEVQLFLHFTRNIQFLPQIACLIMSQHMKIRPDDSRRRQYGLSAVETYQFTEVPPNHLVDSESIEKESVDEAHNLNTMDVFTSIFA